MFVIEKISIPLAKEASALSNPEGTVLVWEKARLQLFVGQLCFLTRDTSNRQKKLHTFDSKTFSEERYALVRGLAQYLSDAQQLNDARPETAYNAGELILRFMNYVDRNGISTAPLSLRNFEIAYAAYSASLKERVSTNSLNKNTAAAYQQAVRSFLREFLDAPMFGSGVNSIRASKNRTNSTLVPDQAAQGRAQGCYVSIFDNLSDLVLDFQPYPLRLKLPPVPPNEEFQIVWIQPSRYLNSFARLAVDPYDQATGLPLTYNDLKEKLSNCKERYPGQRAYSFRKRALTNLAEANEDRGSEIRRHHAITASLCFSALLLAETGINLAELRELPWSDELENSLRTARVVRQGYREIKYRAGGRVVSYEVTLGFMPRLKRYLELRKFILDGKPSPFFLLASGKEEGGIRDLPRSFLENLDLRLATLGVEMNPLTTREWRASKQDFHVTHHGPVVAAKLLCHSIETALRSYSNGTQTAHRTQFGMFFQKLEEIIVAPLTPRDEEKESSIGGCAKYKNPSPISADLLVKPDCKSTEGCLFCDKYRLHADETDIRKLLSCRHCIRLLSGQANSSIEYEISFGIVLRRIEFLLDELRKTTSELVATIQVDVDEEGNLDDFWSAKYAQMMELGLA